MEDVSALTGENQYRRPPKNLLLNEVRFNGQKGEFVYIDTINRKKDERAEETNLGPTIQAVFLKLRRRIGGYHKLNKMFYTSTEHNDKGDTVYLFGAREKGTAEELYNKHKPIIKAQRVVYAYLLRPEKERELVRIIIKGASLSSDREEQANKSTSLLDYIGMEKPKGEHMYMFVTNMKAVEKSGPLGKYYAIDFSRGSKLPEEKLGIVTEKIKELATIAQEQDEYYRDEKNPGPVAELPVIEYPDEDINVDDIPF